MNEKLICASQAGLPQECAIPRFLKTDKSDLSPFCRKLMARAEGFVYGYDFFIHCVFVSGKGKKYRKPNVRRLQAIDALLQAMCYWYDPATNSVMRTVSQLAEDCGLLSVSAAGTRSVSRASRTIQSMADEYGLIICHHTSQHDTDRRIHAGIWFTPELLSALKISPREWSAARHRAEKQNIRTGRGVNNGHQ